MDDNILAQRLPIWLSVDEKRSIGVWLIPCVDYPVGHVFKAGTPVQVEYIGAMPLFGADAERPNGLIACDTVMGEAGCTFSYVTRGIFLVSASQYAISREQIDFLKKRITFVYGKESDIEDDERSCFSNGYWMNALAWSNTLPWVNR